MSFPQSYPQYLWIVSGFRIALILRWAANTTLELPWITDVLNELLSFR